MTPENIRKPLFFMISGSIERDQCHEMTLRYRTDLNFGCFLILVDFKEYLSVAVPGRCSW